jgi:protein involved in polysaccharide export with SLBB domain
VRFRSTLLISTNCLPLAALCAFLLICGGCAKSFLDQSELTRNKGGRLVVPILTSIDPIDEAETEFQGAQEVRPEDLLVIPTDYVIGRNDLITVSVFDLVNMGVESVRTSRVSETGMLSLPGLPDPIKAAGLTEQQLQKAVVERYRETGQVLRAQVSVTVVEARGRTFNITGAVNRPGQYVILESEFRLLNAIIQASGESYPSEFLYVIRKVSSEKPATQPATTPDDTKKPTTGPFIDPLTPRSRGAEVNQPILAMQEPAPAPRPQPTTRPATASEERRFIYIDGRPVLITPGGENTVQPQPVLPRDAGIEMPQPPPDTANTNIQPAPPPDIQIATPAFEFGSSLGMEETRVIRVPYHLLRNGDLRYNIVVRPNDIIIIPLPSQGFYYMGGHFGAPGVFNLTGQKITLKQAVISARMLDGLAVPKKTDVIRRIGGDKEVFVRVNLERIFEGRQPDIFLKANDVVQVGTDWYPPFLAAIRGAFRFTYGFGFIYDRNYAPEQERQD